MGTELSAGRCLGGARRTRDIPPERTSSSQGTRAEMGQKTGGLKPEPVRSQISNQ